MDERIAAIGRFLRDEIAAGRGYQPAGDARLPGVPAAARRGARADRRPGPVPDPRPPDRPLLRGRRATCGRSRRAWPTSTRSCGTTSASCRRRTATSRRGADQGVMLLNRVLTVQPGQPDSHRGRGVGGGHGLRDRRARRRARPVRWSAILWGQRRTESAQAGSVRCPWVESVHPSPLVGKQGRLLRLQALQPSQRAADRAGRGTVDWTLPGIKLNVNYCADMTTDRMPALYIGHGAPPLLDDPIWSGQLAAWAAGPAAPEGDPDRQRALGVGAGDR